MTAPLTLYGMGSPNVRKVGLMLEEIEADYRLVHVAVFRGEQFAPEFRALNPFAKVPVLVAPDLAAPIFESGAILFHLAERAGRFLPAAGSPRYEVMSWLTMQMALMGPMFGQLNHFRIATPAADADGNAGSAADASFAYAEARYAEQARRVYQTLDQRLATHEWIAGGDYSIADMAIHPWAHYLERHRLDPADYPALCRWRDAVDARPAVARSAARFSAAFDAQSAETIQSARTADLERFFARTDSMPPADFSSVLTQR